MSGQFIKQYSSTLGDWAVSSFIAGSADWLFGYHNTDSHLLNVFSAILQFTVVTFGIHETVYSLGMRSGTNTIQNTWITYFAVWTMSPKAVDKLTRAYYSFHRLLYGPDEGANSASNDNK